jgi:hypothetical protein
VPQAIRLSGCDAGGNGGRPAGGPGDGLNQLYAVFQNRLTEDSEGSILEEPELIWTDLDYGCSTASSDHHDVCHALVL